MRELTVSWIRVVESARGAEYGLGSKKKRTKASPATSAIVGLAAVRWHDDGLMIRHGEGSSREDSVERGSGTNN
jgi:hypothetical protein